MGYDAVRGVATYGAGCMPGMTRMAACLRAKFQTGTLGCYNPASVAGGGPSLHAEGRAHDFALNANDPAERARGDALRQFVLAHIDQLGAQEMLWRGGIWSYRRRAEGWRQDGTQQAAHMNHVHFGIDVNAGQHWTEAWLGTQPEPTPAPPTSEGDEMIFYVCDEKNTPHQGHRMLQVGSAFTVMISPAQATKLDADGVPGLDVSSASFQWILDRCNAIAGV